MEEDLVAHPSDVRDFVYSRLILAMTADQTKPVLSDYSMRGTLREKFIADDFLTLVSFTNGPAPIAGKVVTAKVINTDLTQKDWGIGDIEATTSTGKTVVVAHDHTCAKPKVSAHGDLGWSVWKDRDPSNTKTSHSGEILRVRKRDGTMADFYPNSRFIQDWSFVGDDTAVAIASMGFHGHQFYVKYDLKTGRVLDQVDQYKAYNELPAWAQPLSDERP